MTATGGLFPSRLPSHPYWTLVEDVARGHDEAVEYPGPSPRAWHRPRSPSPSRENKSEPTTSSSTSSASLPSTTSDNDDDVVFAPPTPSRRHKSKKPIRFSELTTAFGHANHVPHTPYLVTDDRDNDVNKHDSTLSFVTALSTDMTMRVDPRDKRSGATPARALSSVFSAAPLTPKSAKVLKRSASAGDDHLKDLIESRKSAAAAVSAPARYGVLGPSAGAKFLASDEARAAQNHANSIPDDVTITSSRLDPSPPPAAIPSAAVGSDFPEGSLKELTKRASAEDQAIKSNSDGHAARQRSVSLQNGRAAGLASPFESPPASSSAATKKERKGPPVSGFGVAPRSRRGSNASTGSTASVSKDHMLAQLAEALKKEQRRCKLYEEEIIEVDKEIDAIDKDLDVMREKYTNVFRQQRDTIDSLRAELVEVQRELDTAYDLDEADAAKYLSLISPPSSHSSGASDSSPAPTSTSPDTSPSGTRRNASTSSSSRFTENLLAGVMRPKRLRIARRVDHFIATTDDVDDGVASPRRDVKPFRRPRVLSKSRTPSANALERPSKTVDVSAPTTAAATSTTSLVKRGDDGGGRGGARPARRSSDDKPVDGKRRRPPVSGHAPEALAEEPTPRARKNSFTKTMRNMFFPPLGAAREPDSARSVTPIEDKLPASKQLESWLRESDKQTGRRRTSLYADTALGTGYANPFTRIEV